MKSKANDHILGLDIGGTSIKGAVVDLKSGELISERLSKDTPQPATPDAMFQVVRLLLDELLWDGPVGCGFPAVIKDGRSLTAHNIDREWIGTSVREAFEKSGRKFHVLNDADAAGYAELEYGIARGKKGRLMLLTIGTGIGSVIIEEGRLMEGLELGTMRWEAGRSIEQYASNKARKTELLEWDEWVGRFSEILRYLYSLFYPDLFILGGGVSNKSEFYAHMLPEDLPWALAEMRNDAGIVGAAVYASRKLEK